MYDLSCDVGRLIDVRVREGFVIMNLDTKTNPKIFEVSLLLTWLPNVKVGCFVRGDL